MLENMGSPAFEPLMLHRPPMLLLDGIVDHGAGVIRTTVTIREESQFFDKSLNGVPAIVAVEYMAQSIAALSGLTANEKNKPISMGMLVSCRRFIASRCKFTVGQSLIVQAKENVLAAGGMGSYDCCISLKENPGETLASAQLGVYQEQD